MNVLRVLSVLIIITAIGLLIATTVMMKTTETDEWDCITYSPGQLLGIGVFGLYLGVCIWLLDKQVPRQ